MKKAALTAVFVTLLVLPAAALQAVEVAEGNFVLNVPGSPDNNPLSLRITSPSSGDLVDSSDVVLNFTITKPKTWFLYGSHVIGHVAWAGYSIDDGDFQEVAVNDTGMGAQNAPSALSFSMILSGVPQGKHDVAVSACGESWYGGSPPHINSVESRPVHVYFEVDCVAPEISVLGLNAGTFSDGDVALDFSVSEPALWIGYSIDNQENVTVNGNTTLPNLRNGSHQLTVYTNDTAGNMGKSETVFFTINVQLSPEPPTPSPNPKTSPISYVPQQSSKEPNPTPYVNEAEDFKLAVALGAVLGSAMILGLVAYFNRRKRKL